jgi:arylsulfatase
MPGLIDPTPAHLVDVLPTLAEVAGAEIPASFPGREPTPLAGVSLAPIIAGKPLSKRPPIHLMFGNDRGLRDGDWKLVSFRGQPWELYHLATDRTELNDLAEKEPERVKSMAETWHRMAGNDLMAPAAETRPVAATASPKANGEWSDYTRADGSNTSRRHAPGKTPQGKSKRQQPRPPDS